MEKNSSDENDGFNEMSDSGSDKELKADEPPVTLVIEEGKPSTKKTKKTRSKAQIASFERARKKRAENIAIKKKTKMAENYEAYKQTKKSKPKLDSDDGNESEDIIEKKPAKKKPAKKKKKIVYSSSSSEDESSSSGEEVIVKRRTKSRRKKTPEPVSEDEVIDEGAYFNIV